MLECFKQLFEIALDNCPLRSNERPKMTTLTKQKQNSGFTIAELLVVVAIIGILVAVSIPIFAGQLEKGREATDAANERSAKAAAAVFFYDEKFGTYYYDASSGTLKDSANDIVVYGKGTTAGSIAEDHTKKLLKCVIAQDGTITITWSNGGIISNIAFVIDGKTYDSEQYLVTLAKIANVNIQKGKAVDSSATSGVLLKKINDKLSSIFSDTNIASWKLSNEGGKTFAYITDVDVTKVTAGTKVKVIRYDASTNTYTAMYAVVNKPAGYSYNAITAGSGDDISGQTAETKKSYEDTVKIFNSAASTQ